MNLSEKLNERGFLKDPSLWNEEVASEIARREGLEDLRIYLESFWSDVLSAYGGEVARRNSPLHRSGAHGKPRQEPRHKAAGQSPRRARKK